MKRRAQQALLHFGYRLAVTGQTERPEARSEAAWNGTRAYSDHHPSGGTSVSLVPAWDSTAWLLRGQIPAWSDVEPPNHSLGYRAHRRRRQLSGRCSHQRGHTPEA